MPRLSTLEPTFLSPPSPPRLSVRSTCGGRTSCLKALRALASGGRSPVEPLSGVSEELTHAIRAALPYCITTTNLGVGVKRQGKVRDTYNLGDRVLIVTTDRQSAFDRVLAAVPFKGQVLNQTSGWWMSESASLVPNALLALPDPNVALMKKVQVFPVEFVVRGFLTGTTSTSLWTHYCAGAREYCGEHFPDGLHKNQVLPRNVITPTTKAEDHDQPISPQQIVERRLMSQEDWDAVSAAALRLFDFGQRQAAQRGLLLVDTKYEFGKDAEGNILLVDEVHTPDSSRYWLADSYQQRMAGGQEPQNIDKEFLRLWFREHCDPYRDEVLPEAPAELVVELARRYVFLYEKITGNAFQAVRPDVVPQQRILDNIQALL